MNTPIPQLAYEPLAALRDIIRTEFIRAQPDDINAEVRANELTKMLGERIARMAIIKPSPPLPRDSYRLSDILNLPII
ncbi:hypothetical protein [Hymenobacter sp. PAMC 26628]|uniref:hypothetical protein n=1 Tax=Hymenobacter sp. PAMC 26628 TaxID=1484118 RepID=UPI0012FFC26F|nr:hypothetical protein [Hymenobacter sp. PAMC 26628]